MAGTRTFVDCNGARCAGVHDTRWCGADFVLGRRRFHRGGTADALQPRHESVAADDSAFHVGRLFSGRRRRVATIGARFSLRLPVVRV